MGGPLTDIPLKYVHGYRDRHDRWRYYVRRKGHKRVALPGEPGSEAFMAAYHAALAAGASAPAVTSSRDPRSVAALIQSFYASAAFKNLKGRSPKTYRHVLKHFEARDGHRSVADLPEDKARKIIEEIGADRPALANLTRAVLRKLFAHAVKLKWRPTNPFVGIETYRTGSHHTWTDPELHAYVKRWPLGTRERVAFDLLFYTTQRVGDVARMKRTDIVKGVLHVTQEKTGAELRIPVHPELRASLNAYGIRGRYLVGRLDGRKIGGENLSKIVKAAAEVAGLPPRCVPHGIRKGALRILAELEASGHVLKSISGHKTLKEVSLYTDAADQGRLATVAVATLPALNAG